jgi:hypothetical protein
LSVRQFILTDRRSILYLTLCVLSSTLPGLFVRRLKRRNTKIVEQWRREKFQIFLSSTAQLS